MNINLQKAFTLVEMLIVVILIAILSSIAYPAYLDTVRKARRTDAQQALMEAAFRLENYYARNARYTGSMTAIGYERVNWNNVNAGSDSVYYQMNINNPAGCELVNCYLLESRNRGDQQKDDVEWYRLWSTGRKQIKRTAHAIQEGW